MPVTVTTSIGNLLRALTSSKQCSQGTALPSSQGTTAARETLLKRLEHAGVQAESSSLFESVLGRYARPQQSEGVVVEQAQLQTFLQNKEMRPAPKALEDLRGLLFHIPTHGPVTCVPEQKVWELGQNLYEQDARGAFQKVPQKDTYDLCGQYFRQDPDTGVFSKIGVQETVDLKHIADVLRQRSYSFPEN